jgi:hypothetical protein
MSNGAATHPDNDWVHRAAEYYIVRAEDHCGSQAPATSARIIFSMRDFDILIWPTSML